MNLGVLLAAVFLVVSVSAQANPSLTPAVAIQKMETFKAASRQQPAPFPFSDNEADIILNHIGKAEPDWLMLIPSLATMADASFAEGLTIAMATALPSKPAEILHYTTAGASESRVDVTQVCGMPFIEQPHKQALAYQVRTKAAVGKVNDPDLQTIKAACLTQLTAIKP